jgi:peptidoglycan hydrolase-like protein with peptidoglycan-binding domain
MTSFSFASYVPADHCEAEAGEGAQAMLAFCLDKWSYTSSLGIFNCRTARGSTSLSHHAEGRAIDVGIPTISPTMADAAKGMQVAETLGSCGKRLGLDHLIYNRRIWSARTPTGREYTGVHPHLDHIHAGLTRQAAANLTYATLQAVIGDGVGQLAGEEDDILGFNIGAVGEPSVAGDRAKALQLMLIDRGYQLPRFGADGRAGDETRKALRRFKADNNLAEELEGLTGVVGPHTYAALFKTS